MAPRAGGLDWILGGACTGLLLGLAELLVNAPLVWLPPALALALIATCTATVTAGAIGLWLLSRLRGLRYTRSGVVGGMLGPLLAVASYGAVGRALAGMGWPWGQLLPALVGGILVVAGGVTGASIAQRFGGNRPTSALLTWAGAPLLLAGLGRSLHLGSAAAGWLALVSIPVGAILVGAGLLGLSPPGTSPRRGFGGPFFALLLASAVAPFGPWLLPWLLFDRSTPDVGRWPPNLLFVALKEPEGPQNAGLETSLPVELMAVDGVSYPRLIPEPDIQSLLKLPDGTRLAHHLRGAGYTTAAILTVPDPLLEVGIDYADDRAGGRSLLEESAAWTAGAPLLLGRASGLLPLLGQGALLRTPEQLGAEAARWVMGWRTLRAPAPFFLLVDFRAPGASVEAIDVGLDTLLDGIEGLQLDTVTIVVVAIERHDAPGASGPALRALIKPPMSWSRATRREVAAQIWGRDLSQALLRIALSDGDGPVTLPGLGQELSPPPLR